MAQPLYDLLNRYPAFLSAHGLLGLDLIGFVAALSLLAPLAIWAPIMVIRAFRVNAARHLNCAVLAAGTLAVVCGAAWKLMPAAAWLSAAVGICAWLAVCWCYSRFVAARSVVTALIPAAVVFPAVFLLSGSAWQALRAQEPPVVAYQPEQTPPVVLVVFDEFPLTALTNGSSEIDPIRFPNFGRLAAGATWFRNATTVATRTERAVPAILTGNRVAPGSISGPIAAEFPQNLFTLLGERYQITAEEPVTRLCPAQLCSLSARTFEWHSQLVQDLSILYLHIVYPPALRAELPSIDQAWAGFQFGEIQKHAEALYQRGRRQEAEKFISGIEAGAKPPLLFLHANLPHTPYQYSPTGHLLFRQLPLRGLTRTNGSDRWRTDPNTIKDMRQLFLWQARFVDRLLGQLLERLQAVGLYDNALIIVTSDHGMSMRPGDLRRWVSETNARDVLGVPLLVKLPGQRQGRVDDQNVESIDILPLIADVLGAPVPWPVAGRSPLEGSERSERSHKEVFDVDTVKHFPANLMLTGKPQEDRWWPEEPRSSQHLIGQSLDRFVIEAGTPASLPYEQIYSNVVPNVFVPSIVTGTLEGEQTPLVLVALNGIIQAQDQAFREAGQTRFYLTIEESHFLLGKNRLEVFVVPDETNARRLLRVFSNGTPDPPQ